MREANEGIAPVEIAYTTTLDDYVAFSMHMLRKSKAARGRFMASWLILPLVALFAAAILAITDGLLSETPITLAVVGVLYIVIFPSYHRRWIAKYVRNYAKQLGARGVVGPIRLILSDESLTEITELTRTEAKWENMNGIEEVGDYTFILITGMSAAIVPRHGFERDGDYLMVRDFALARIGDREQQLFSRGAQ